MDMQTIDVITLKTWFLNVIEKHKLSNKKYKEMKSNENMLFDYAKFLIFNCLMGQKYRCI